MKNAKDFNSFKVNGNSLWGNSAIFNFATGLHEGQFLKERVCISAFLGYIHAFNKDKHKIKSIVDGQIMTGPLLWPSTILATSYMLFSFLQDFLPVLQIRDNFGIIFHIFS